HCCSLAAESLTSPSLVKRRNWNSRITATWPLNSIILIVGFATPKLCDSSMG
ncbi:hypothetical protein JMJ77_0010042, partial [Colletotrichum scovillei]